MEELLNKLIEKGWKPFGTKNKVFKVAKTEHNWWYFDWWFWNEVCFSLREITSKESWLWQFVCENGMVKHEVYEEIHSWVFTTADHSDFWYTSWDNYEFRIIQSALLDEDELEQFLLDNVKIEW